MLRLSHEQPSYHREKTWATNTPSVVCLEFQAGKQRLVLGLESGATPTITLLPSTLLAAAQNQQGQRVCLQGNGQIPNV